MTFVLDVDRRRSRGRSRKLRWMDTLKSDMKSTNLQQPTQLNDQMTWRQQSKRAVTDRHGRKKNKNKKTNSHRVIAHLRFFQVDSWLRPQEMWDARGSDRTALRGSGPAQRLRWRNPFRFLHQIRPLFSRCWSRSARTPTLRTVACRWDWRRAVCRSAVTAFYRSGPQIRCVGTLSIAHRLVSTTASRGATSPTPSETDTVVGPQSRKLHKTRTILPRRKIYSN